MSGSTHPHQRSLLEWAADASSAVGHKADNFRRWAGQKAESAKQEIKIDAQAAVMTADQLIHHPKDALKVSTDFWKQKLAPTLDQVAKIVKEANELYHEALAVYQRLDKFQDRFCGKDIYNFGQAVNNLRKCMTTQFEALAAGGAVTAETGAGPIIAGLLEAADISLNLVGFGGTLSSLVMCIQRHIQEGHLSPDELKAAKSSEDTLNKINGRLGKVQKGLKWIQAIAPKIESVLSKIPG